MCASAQRVVPALCRQRNSIVPLWLSREQIVKYLGVARYVLYAQGRHTSKVPTHDLISNEPSQASKAGLHEVTNPVRLRVMIPSGASSKRSR